MMIHHGDGYNTPKSAKFSLNYSTYCFVWLRSAN